MANAAEHQAFGVARNERARIFDEALPLPLPIRLMGLTLSNLEREGVVERPRDEAQLSLL